MQIRNRSAPTNCDQFCSPKLNTVEVRLALVVSIVISLSISGCYRAAFMKKMVPEADDTFARNRIDQLRQGRFEQIQRELDASISDPNPPQTLSTMERMFPAGEPKSVKAVDIKFIENQGSSTHSLTLEYEFSEAWLLVNIAIKRADGRSTISAFNVTRIADGLENINRFSLVGKSGLQYLVLFLALALPLFTFYALLLCLREKRKNFKWLWAVFILLGVGEFTINWTTGELSFRLLAVHIPCASLTAVPAYGPWVIAVSLPLGAVLFMARRSKNPMQDSVSLPPAEQSPPNLPQ